MIESIWLLVFLIIWIGSLIITSENDSAILSYCIIIVGLAISEFLFHIPIWATMLTNPLIILITLIIYLAIGIIYAAKWELPSFLKKYKNEIIKDYDRYKAATQVSVFQSVPQIEVTEEDFLKSTFNRFKLSENKDRIVAWITLWPLKILWDLSHKPFIWAWNKIYYLTSTMFNEINNKILLNILKNK